MNLRLLQISDSALPIGGYTHSWGLEAAIVRRLVEDADSLERFVRNWLWHALGPLEGVVVSAACRAAASGDWQTVARANAILTASIAPPSIRSATLRWGSNCWLWPRPGSGVPGEFPPSRPVPRRAATFATGTTPWSSGSWARSPAVPRWKPCRHTSTRPSRV